MKKFIKKISSFLIALGVALTSFSATADDRVSYTDNYLQNRSTTTIKMLHSKYPDGSYFSTTGKPCNCHNDSSVECTCIKFNGGIQCVGFARYCYYMYNDAQVDYAGMSDYYQKYYILNTDAKIETFLKKAKSQSYVQGMTNTNVSHAIFIVDYSLTNDTVTVYDANMDNCCNVSLKTYSYKDFRKHMYKVRWCYTRDEYTYGYDDFV